jgi:hypothetical protein
MKRNLMGFAVWAAVYIGAMAANLGSFWMGDAAAVGQLAVTALYAAVILILLWLVRNSRRWMRHGFFWGIAAIAGGVFCLLARQGVPWAAIPGLILGGALFTPFYGLTCLVILEDWDVFYAAMLALSVVWTAVCALLLWRWKRKANEAES